METFHALFDRLGDEEKDGLLRDAGVQAFIRWADAMFVAGHQQSVVIEGAAQVSDGQPFAFLVLPPDLEKRAQDWAASRQFVLARGNPRHGLPGVLSSAGGTVATSTRLLFPLDREDFRHVMAAPPYAPEPNAPLALTTD